MNEAEGRLSDKAVEALRESGLFGLMVPKSLGGLEADPVTAIEVLEAVSEADAGAGWVLMASSANATAAAMLLPDAGAEIAFGKGVPVVAGAGAPTGRADVEGNGYRLTGRWSYGSGILHSDYLHTGGRVYENGKPRLVPGTEIPLELIFIVPTREAELLGNWDTLGLRATGSLDYSLTDVFVPAEMAHSPLPIIPKRGGNNYRIGMVGLTAIGHAGFAMGVGRRVLAELLALVHKNGKRPTGLAELGGSDAFKQNYAVAEARLRAGRAFVIDTWREIMATVGTGVPISTRQVSMARLALFHVTAAVGENAHFAFRAAGGASLRAGALQRAVRDTLTATQHRIVSDLALLDCGRELLGLAEGLDWIPRGLADAKLRASAS